MFRRHPAPSALLLLLVSLVLPGLGSPTAAAARESADEEEARTQEHRSGRHHPFDLLREWAPFPVSRGRIGVQVQPMTPELRAFMGAPSDRGMLIERIVEDSPAEAAGLRVGDVIIEVGDAPVEHTPDLVRAINSLEEGEALEIRFVRERETERVEVTPEAIAHPLRGALEGHSCTEADCPHGGRGHYPGESRRRLERRLDEIEKRLKALESESAHEESIEPLPHT